MSLVHESAVQTWMLDGDGELMPPALDLFHALRLSDAQWDHWWAAWDQEGGARSSGRRGVKFLRHIGDREQPRWVAVVDALIEIERIAQADRDTALRAEWIKYAGCPGCGSSGAFVRRDEAGRYDRGQVRVSCGRRCRTRDVLAELGIEPIPEPDVAEVGADELMSTPEAAESPEGLTNGWESIDLAETVAGLQNGTLRRPEPSVGRFGDGCGLFYAGRVNGIHGDSNAAKTWTALVTCRQELAAGHVVVYVDLEDDPSGIVGRLLDLGADPDSITRCFRYLRPEGRLNQAAADAMRRMLAKEAPTLAVIDSTGEALALEGANPNADEEVAHWFRLLPRELARCGAAVLLLDHATKAGDNALWPIGSQRKRAAITGAAYRQKVVQSFARGQGGRAALTCAKDRGGNYRAGRNVAELVARGDTFTLEAAEENTTNDGAFRPTYLMERVSEYLDHCPGATWYRIREKVKGNNAGKQAAVARLVAEGYVATEPGPRGSKKHTNVRRFHEATDPRGQVTGPPRTGTCPVPKEGDRRTGAVTCPGDRSGTGRGQVGEGAQSEQSGQSDQGPTRAAPTGDPEASGSHQDRLGEPCPDPSHAPRLDTGGRWACPDCDATEDTA